jgi:outer membrane protein TolC
MFRPSLMSLARTTLFVLASAFLLAGCVDVDHEVASTPQEYWQPVARAKPAESLTLSAPPANVTDQQLSLPALVDLALTNNPNTRAAWYNAKAAAARLGETNSQYYPQISLNVTADRAKNRNVGTNGQTFAAGTFYTDFIGPSIDLNYVLWNFGKNDADSESSRQALYAANYQYNQQIQDTLLATELAYFNHNAAQGFVEAAQATLNDANTAYNAANQRLTAGLGTRQEERQAFAQVKNAEFQLEQAQAQVETTRAQLAQVLGIPVAANLNIVRSETLPSSTSIDADVSGLMADAMRQRPDLMAAYANMMQARSNLDSSKDAQYPTISAFANATYGRDYGGNAIGNPQQNYEVGLQASWQIFTGFEQTYAILNAQEQEDAARATLRAQELKVITDVWSSFYAYKSALRQVDSTTAQADAQQEAYTAINTGYTAGLNSYVDLQTSLDNLATARQQKVQAEANLGTAIATLAHATGNMPIAQTNPAK